VSSSPEGEPAASPKPEATGTLYYDVALPYAAQTVPMPVVALLDTGAEFSAFDGRIAQQAGWSMEEITRRALDVKAMHGFTRRGPSVEGYVHEVTCDIGFGARFAELRFRAVITPPNTLAFPVLGRAGFFEQVDVTFAEFEKMLYMRFRDPAFRRLFA
jgi:hypothetical protein